MSCPNCCLGVVMLLRGAPLAWAKAGRTASRHNERNKIRSFIGERDSLGMVAFISVTDDRGPEFEFVDFLSKQVAGHAKGWVSLVGLSRLWGNLLRRFQRLIGEMKMMKRMVVALMLTGCCVAGASAQ